MDRRPARQDSPTSKTSDSQSGGRTRKDRLDRDRPRLLQATRNGNRNRQNVSAARAKVGPSGYIIRRRAAKIIRDQDTGERIIKGNLDTEIVLDMFNTIGNYDVAFLFSGDSDFERAVDLLRSRGKRLYIVTARAQLSRELAYVADKSIFYLEDHRERLAREDRAPAT